MESEEVDIDTFITQWGWDNAQGSVLGQDLHATPYEERLVRRDHIPSDAPTRDDTFASSCPAIISAPHPSSTASSAVQIASSHHDASSRTSDQSHLPMRWRGKEPELQLPRARPQSSPHQSSSLRAPPTISVTQHTTSRRDDNCERPPRQYWDDPSLNHMGSGLAARVASSIHAVQQPPNVQSELSFGPQYYLREAATTSRRRSVTAGVNRKASITRSKPLSRSPSSYGSSFGPGSTSINSNHVEQLANTLLNAWFEIQLINNGGQVPSPPRGQDLLGLMRSTHANADFIQSWFQRRSGLGSVISPTSSIQSSIIEPSPTSSQPDQTRISAEDERDVWKFVRESEVAPCTSKRPYPHHGKPYSCHHCGAGANTFTEWRRHRETRFPMRFFRCRLCDKIESRHIHEHTRKVHGLESDTASYQISFDPPWSGSCECCNERFNGLRNECWKRLQDHIWEKHVKDYPNTSASADLPDRPRDDDDGNGGGKDRDDDDFDIFSSFEDDMGVWPGQSYQSFGYNNTTYGTGPYPTFHGNNHGALEQWLDTLDDPPRGRPRYRRTLDLRRSRPAMPGRGLAFDDDPDFELRFFGVGLYEEGEDSQTVGAKHATQDAHQFAAVDFTKQLPKHFDTAPELINEIEPRPPVCQSERPKRSPILPKSDNQTKMRPKSKSECPILSPLRPFLSGKHAMALAEYQDFDICLGGGLVLSHHPPETDVRGSRRTTSSVPWPMAQWFRRLVSASEKQTLKEERIEQTDAWDEGYPGYAQA